MKTHFVTIMPCSPARYVKFDATELELDEMVSALEDNPPPLNFQQAVDEASRKGLRIEWGEAAIRRVDHRGNPLEIYLPGIPKVYGSLVVSLNGWMMMERHDYSILFTQGGALLVFPLDFWETAHLRHGGSPLLLAWYVKGQLQTKAFMLKRGH